MRMKPKKQADILHSVAVESAKREIEINKILNIILQEYEIVKCEYMDSIQEVMTEITNIITKKK